MPYFREFSDQGHTLFVGFNGDVSPDGVLRTACYGFEVDPLTGESLKSWWEGEPGDRIDLVELPYRERFIVDCVDRFECWVFYKVSREKQWLRSFAKKFIPSIRAFCHEHGLLTSDDVDQESIYSDEFTDLGLDFMRQRYRWIKEQAVVEKRVPGLSELEHWLIATKQNRTSDEDWRWDRTGFGDVFATDPGVALPITDDNYPGLRTTHHMNFVGEAIDDLSFLTLSLRLESLVLRDIAADDFSPLANIPTLENVYLYEIDLKDVAIPEMKFVKNLRLNNVRIDSFHMLEPSRRLGLLRLVNCEFDAQSLDDFLMARPDVTVNIVRSEEDATRTW